MELQLGQECKKSFDPPLGTGDFQRGINKTHCQERTSFTNPKQAKKLIANDGKLFHGRVPS